MRQEPKLFSSERPQEAPKDGFWVEPRDDIRPEAHHRHRDDDDDDRDGPRFPWRWLIGVVVVAVLAVGGWQGFRMLSSGVTGGGDVPLFSASVDPFKQRPDDPGGMEVPNQESAIYGGVLGETDTEGLEVLLPEPEEPIEIAPEVETALGEDGGIDVVVPGVAELAPLQEGEVEDMSVYAQAGATPNQVMTAAGPVPLPQTKPTPPPAPAVTQVDIAPTDGTVTTETGVAAGTGEGGLSFADVAASLGGAGTAPAAEEGTLPAESVTVDTSVLGAEPALPDEEEEAAVVTTDIPAATGGVARVQIAAYSSREAATEAWQRLATQNADILGSVDAQIMETTIAGTTFHRLQVGAYPTAADAQRLCDSLRQRQIDCMVVGP